MTLDDLYKHWTEQHWRRNSVPELYLSGVDQGAIPMGAIDNHDDASNCLLFVVNDVGYCVSEDPDDGYRSSMRDIVIIPAELIRNRFEPVLVTAKFDVNIISLDDAGTGQEVLAFGTDNCDDYYPCFVATWLPQNLSANITVAMEARVTVPVERTAVKARKEGPRAIRLRDA